MSAVFEIVSQQLSLADHRNFQAQHFSWFLKKVYKVFFLACENGFVWSLAKTLVDIVLLRIRFQTSIVIFERISVREIFSRRTWISKVQRFYILKFLYNFQNFEIRIKPLLEIFLVFSRLLSANVNPKPCKLTFYFPGTHLEVSILLEYCFCFWQLWISSACVRIESFPSVLKSRVFWSQSCQELICHTFQNYKKYGWKFVFFQRTFSRKAR